MIDILHTGVVGYSVKLSKRFSSVRTLVIRFFPSVCRCERPPSNASSGIQAILSRLASAPLSRSVVVKGLQHPSPLVQHTTLHALLKVLQSMNPVLLDLEAAVKVASHQISASTDALKDAQIHSGMTSHELPLSSPVLPEQQPPSDMTHAEELLTTDDYLAQHAASAAAAFEQVQQQQDMFVLGSPDQERSTIVLSHWQGFADQLQQAFRARLPDPQSLIALLANLQKSKEDSTVAVAVASPTFGKLAQSVGKACTAGTTSTADTDSLPSSAGKAGKASTAGQAGVAGIAGNAGTADTAGAAGTAGTAGGTGFLSPTAPADSTPSDIDTDSYSRINPKDQHSQQTLAAGLEAELPGRLQAMTASDLTGTLLFKVLQQYQECFPEALSDGHVDVASLLPQVCLAPPL